MPAVSPEANATFQSTAAMAGTRALAGVQRKIRVSEAQWLSDLARWPGRCPAGAPSVSPSLLSALPDPDSPGMRTRWFLRMY